MKYYPHHIGDFDRATRHLTRLERSIYRDLIELYYDTEKPLIDDTAALCRRIIARTNEEVTSVEQVLNEFFIKTHDGWFHSRCDTEIDKFLSSNTQKSQAGKASAAKRALKKQQALNVRSTDVLQTCNGTPTILEPRTKILEPLKDIDAQQAGVEPKQKRKRRLPADFLITDERIRAAKQFWQFVNRDDLDPIQQFEMFRNHFSANGKPMLDWDACWRTWYSNAPKFNKSQGINNGQIGIGHSVNQRPNNSAVGRVRANAERERAKLAVSGSGIDNTPLGTDDRNVRTQMDESVRGRDRSEQCMGGIIEGDYARDGEAWP